MAMWKQSAAVVAVAMIAFAAGRLAPGGDSALAQPPKDAKDKKKEAQPADQMKQMMEKMMAQMQPGPEHKKLDVMLGNWEGDVKFWMNPGDEPMTSHGTAKREWMLNGRWLAEHVDAPAMMEGGPAFKGFGLTGYNTIEKRYEMYWFENMSTWAMTATGKWDDAKKTLTFEGDDIDPATGKRRHTRSSVDLSNPNREVMVGYTMGPDGKEFKSFEGTFEKKGAGAAGEHAR